MVSPKKILGLGGLIAATIVSAAPHAGPVHDAVTPPNSVTADGPAHYLRMPPELDRRQVVERRGPMRLYYNAVRGIYCFILGIDWHPSMRHSMTEVFKEKGPSGPAQHLYEHFIEWLRDVERGGLGEYSSQERRELGMIRDALSRGTGGGFWGDRIKQKPSMHNDYGWVIINPTFLSQVSPEGMGALIARWIGRWATSNGNDGAQMFIRANDDVDIRFLDHVKDLVVRGRVNKVGKREKLNLGANHCHNPDNTLLLANGSPTADLNELIGKLDFVGTCNPLRG